MKKLKNRNLLPHLSPAFVVIFSFCLTAQFVGFYINTQRNVRESSMATMQVHAVETMIQQVQPKSTETQIPTHTPTFTPSQTNTPTPSYTPSQTPTITQTFTVTPSVTPTLLPVRINQYAQLCPDMESALILETSGDGQKQISPKDCWPVQRNSDEQSISFDWSGNKLGYGVEWDQYSVEVVYPVYLPRGEWRMTVICVYKCFVDYYDNSLGSPLLQELITTITVHGDELYSRLMFVSGGTDVFLTLSDQAWFFLHIQLDGLKYDSQIHIQIQPKTE